MAAVYRTPLPVVMDMPLCSILSWLSDLPVVLPILEPLMPTTPKPSDQAADLQAFITKAGLDRTGGPRG